MEEKKHEHHKIEHHAHKKQGLKIKKSDLWKSATTILAIIAVVLVILLIRKGESPTGPVLSQEEAANKAIGFINTNMLQAGTSATLVSVTEKSNMYNLRLDISGREFDSYITKDGELLFPSVVDLSAEVELPEEQVPEPAPGIEKSDKPTVELYIMSHCPYGTQAEKGIIPVAELLGNKIDFEIKYVNYAMHGEVEVLEQLNQYCIKTEQKTKFLDYLKCFLKEGDGASCLTETGIDKAKLDSCTKAADKEFKITESLEDKSTWSGGRFPLFLIDDEDNKKYGVRGSPSLVINGKSTSSARSPAAYLSTICSAFTEAPEECDEEVSTSTPSPGFGLETTGAATDASCG